MSTSYGRTLFVFERAGRGRLATKVLEGEGVLNEIVGLSEVSRVHPRDSSSISFSRPRVSERNNYVGVASCVEVASRTMV